MIIRNRILGLLLASASVFAANAVVAADYEPPVFEAPVDEGEYVPVEVGSGWYLRGDVSYVANEPYQDRFTVTSPDFQRDKFMPATIGFGLGYHFNDFLRAELNVATSPKYEGSFQRIDNPGTPSEEAFAGSAEGYGFTGLVNAYADLGTFAGITPYVGGGLGLAYHRIDASEPSQPYDNPLLPPVRVFNDRDYALAYSLGAGIQYKVSSNVALDLGYQFLSSPEAKRAVLVDDGFAIVKGIDLHQVKVGLRYDIW